MFKERVSDRIKGANVDHAGLSNALLNCAREQQGGKRKEISNFKGGVKVKNRGSAQAVQREK